MVGSRMTGHDERQAAAMKARRLARASAAWDAEIAKAHNRPGRLTYLAAARRALAAWDRELRSRRTT